MTVVKCPECAFWERINDKGGTCRRYPPTATPMPAQIAGKVLIGNRPSPINFMDVISWRKTNSEDWCGEFKNDA